MDPESKMTIGRAYPAAGTDPKEKTYKETVKRLGQMKSGNPEVTRQDLRLGASTVSIESFRGNHCLIIRSHLDGHPMEPGQRAYMNHHELRQLESMLRNVLDRSPF